MLVAVEPKEIGLPYKSLFIFNVKRGPSNEVEPKRSI